MVQQREARRCRGSNLRSARARPTIELFSEVDDAGSGRRDVITVDVCHER